jgi:hypothetical protein
MSDIVFAREIFTEALLDETLPLVRAHWREVAHYADIPLDPDASAYHHAEFRGFLRVYTARKVGPLGDHRLVGYAAYFVRPSIHYASSVQASQDVIYVSPECRGSTGARLIQFADEQLAGEGVQAVYHHVKVAHNWGRLLERMGYEAVDVIYAKRLDRKEVV